MMQKLISTLLLFLGFSALGCQLQAVSSPRALSAQSQTQVSAPTQAAPQTPHQPEDISKQSGLTGLPAATPATLVSSAYETYRSQVMGEQRQYGVSLPPGYNQHPEQRYPVIFLLHGGHGDSTDWWQPQKGNASVVLQKLYEAGQLPPSIVITPDGNDLRGSSPERDPAYIDGPNGKVSTAIGDELVKVVQSRYRTLPAPNFWAIGGLSSGGWGAVNIGLHHPQQFSILFSHSGYFEDKSGAQNSPLQFINTLPAQARQQLHFYFDTGRSDDFCLGQAEAFHQKLDELGVSNIFNVFSGAHTWHYWHQHLSDSLAFVGEQFRQAQTHPIAQ